MPKLKWMNANQWRNLMILSLPVQFSHEQKVLHYTPFVLFPFSFKVFIAGKFKLPVERKNEPILEVNKWDSIENSVFHIYLCPHVMSYVLKTVYFIVMSSCNEFYIFY